ncbi:unnamed protein product, partial [marine sediment metagenome]
AAAIVTLLVGLTGFIVVPLRRMRVMTIPEFYERRFGKTIRIMGGIILAFAGIINMGMFLKAGSLFVAGVTGLTDPVYIKIIMTVMLGMVLIYTTLGGMVAVVVLDYIQFVVLSFCLLFMCILSIQHLGWDNLIDTVAKLRGEAGFNPFHEGGFGFSYVAWMFFGGLASCAIWQTAVIRACAAESTSVVKKLYTWSSIGFLIRWLLPVFLGVSAFVFIANDPHLKAIFIPDGAEASPDTTMLAMPIYLSRVIPFGLIGVITAGMLAA